MTTTVSAVLVCLLLQCIIDSHPAASQPVINASPQDIDLGITDALDVNCTVSTAGWSNAVELNSLIVYRNTSQIGLTELGIISRVSKGKVNVLTNESLTATGWFMASDSASVNLHWDYPTDQQMGNYICSVQDYDSVGRTMASNTEVQVTAHDASLPDVEDKLRVMETQMKIFERQMNSEIQRLKLEITELKQGKESRVPEIFETFVLEYKNHTYYVSTDAFYNIYVSLAICRIYGGHLVQIDDIDEYNAIKAFLSPHSGFDVVYISGTDTGQEGEWTFFLGEDFPFLEYEASGDPPGNFNNIDCIALFRSSTWEIAVNVCQQDEPSLIYRYMCEVP